VVPKIGDDSQTDKAGAGDRAEVAHSHVASNQEAVESFVQRIEEAEDGGLGSSSPFGENDSGAPLGAGTLEQARNIAGIVLTVAIHDDEELATPTVFNEGDTDGQGPLVSQVSAETQDLDGGDGTERPAAVEFRWWGSCRSIVTD
jgi:hypothetical protein